MSMINQHARDVNHFGHFWPVGFFPSSMRPAFSGKNPAVSSDSRAPSRPFVEDVNRHPRGNSPNKNCTGCFLRGSK